MSIKSSVVDIAHSYTKKKNVFRLSTYNGSEYLLQADDQHTMMSWIQVIQSHNNPDADVSHDHIFNPHLRKVFLINDVVNLCSGVSRF